MNKTANLRLCAARIMVALFAAMLPFAAYAQSTVRVTGTVTDDTNEPVIGASVMVKGSTTGVPTDLDGKYSIDVLSDAVLEFSSIGFRTAEEKVAGRSVINVTLSPDQNFLDEVVVVGYGTQKRGSVTGAISGVNNEEMLKTKSENPTNMLTGRVSGLRVWQKNAEPGTYRSDLDIRGLGSPLVIIDGVPRDISDFQRLNPQDIDNVSVLKDASAAVYGMRAGNGVVLVTTKKGQEGKTKVNYNGSMTFQTPLSMPKLTDAIDAMMLWNEKNTNSVTGGAPAFTDADIEAYRNGTKKGTDWNSLVFSKVVPQTQHDVSVSGGSDKFQYYLSMGYLYQEGFFASRDLNYDKYNVRANVNAEIVKGLKLNLDLTAMTDTRNTPYHNSPELIRTYWATGSIYPAYADPEQTMLNYSGLELDKNVIAMMTADISGYRKYQQKKLTSSASLEYDFGTIADALKGLSVKGMFSYDYRHDDNESFRKEYSLYAYDSVKDIYNVKTYGESSPSNLSKTSYNFSQQLAQALVNYDRTFSGHHIGVVAGYEYQRKVTDAYNASGDLTFATPYFTALSGENQIVGLNSLSDYMYHSVIGRLNYDYNSRYLIEAQFRYDGSSKLSKGHQWGFFPSVSAGWRISEEPFFAGAKSVVNQLKIRASYGELGDDSSLNYEWITGYKYRGGETNDKGWYTGYVPGYIFDGSFVYSADPSSLPNDNITWLRNKTFDIGVDFEAWNGMLGFSGDWFQRKRTGIFKQNNLGIPTLVGAAAPMENLDSDSHFGLELELSHRNQVGEFFYSLKGMVSVTRQKYLHSAEKGSYGNSYDQWRHDNLNNRYQGVQFGYESAGRYTDWEDIWSYPLYKENNVLPGDYKYVDWNGDGIIDGWDEHPYAFDQTPWMNYSLAFSCNWKGIDMSLLFQGSALGSVEYAEPLYSIWGQTGCGTLEQYLDRWHPVTAGADIYDPSTEWVSGYYAYTGHSPRGNSGFNRVSTAFLRLKSIEVGYTIPKIAKAKDFSLRVYANCYNPFTITKVKFIDPEHPSDDLGRMYPLNRTYTVGLSLAF